MPNAFPTALGVNPQIPDGRYQIVSDAVTEEGQALYLAFVAHDANARAVTAPFAWNVQYNANLGGYHFTDGNDALCYYLASSAVYLDEGNFADQWQTFTLGDTGGGHYAIRARDDDNYNVNIKGGAPYTDGQSIFLYTWDHQPNSIWRFIPA